MLIQLKWHSSLCGEIEAYTPQERPGEGKVGWWFGRRVFYCYETRRVAAVITTVQPISRAVNKDHKKNQARGGAGPVILRGGATQSEHSLPCWRRTW